MASEPCRSCGKPMLWAITVHGNRQPVDPEAVPDGNLILEERPDREEPNVIVVGKLDDAVLFDPWEGRRHKPHHATCPQGSAWRQTMRYGGVV